MKDAKDLATARIKGVFKFSMTKFYAQSAESKKLQARKDFVYRDLNRKLMNKRNMMRVRR